MNFAALAKPRVLTQPVYEPGRPIADVAREYGLEPGEVAKLASNENPFGPSPAAREAAVRALGEAHLYPDGSCRELRLALARERGVEPEQILVGNGSNEILELVGHAFLEPGDEAVMGRYAFIVYKLVTKLFGATPVETAMPDYRHDLRALAAGVTERTRLVFLASPNNPTGAVAGAEEVAELLEALPEHVLLVLDEAYAEYVEAPVDLRPAMAAGKKVLACRTFSKIYGLGGLRLGYAYGHPDLIALLQRVRQPFNVNAVAQAAGVAALGDRDWVEACLRANREGREYLEAACVRLGLATVPGEANFVLVETPEARGWCEALQRRGLIVRPLGPYGMPRHLRITVGTPEQNRRLVAALEALQAESAAGRGAGRL